MRKNGSPRAERLSPPRPRFARVESAARASQEAKSQTINRKLLLDLRDELVPLNKKYPIAELLAACRAYPTATNARRITFEYVMLKGVNDTPADARALVRLLAGIPAKVNLIPFSPVEKYNNVLRPSSRFCSRTTCRNV